MKKARRLWRISVETSIEAEDAVAELLHTLLQSGASSYLDVEKQMSIVSVYSQEIKSLSPLMREQLSSGLKRISCSGLNIGSGMIKTAKVPREDWAESWKRHFKPIQIGDALLVKPSWSKQRAKKNQAVVVLDPGLSFGTGQHPTTEYCLSEIARCAGPEKSFLDIGTGSGILAIAAVKLGGKPVRAFDLDPEALRVARSNASVNGVSRKLRIELGDVTRLSTKPREKFDLVCANLIANLLVAEREKISAQLKPEGVLVLAGILKLEFLEVQKAFEKSGLKLISSCSKKEWRSGSFAFRSKKF